MMDALAALPPHALRHTWRTVAADCGVDELLAHFMLGAAVIGDRRRREALVGFGLVLHGIANAADPVRIGFGAAKTGLFAGAAAGQIKTCKAGTRKLLDSIGKRAVTPRRQPNSELRSREHLTETEVEKLTEAAKDNRYGQ